MDELKITGQSILTAGRNATEFAASMRETIATEFADSSLEHTVRIMCGAGLAMLEKESGSEAVEAFLMDLAASYHFWPNNPTK
jgi:hypothetical protein